MKQICEVCKSEWETDKLYKFCPECGFGFKDTKSKDKGHHIRSDAGLNSLFAAAVVALSWMTPGDKWHQWILVTFVPFFFFVFGEVVCEMIARRNKSQLVRYLLVLLAAVAAGMFLHFLDGNSFIIFDAIFDR